MAQKHVKHLDVYDNVNPGQYLRGMGAALHYIFIPCDGSVATGEGDIGCNGHKNRAGQAEVAEFLIPKIAKIMKWSSGWVSFIRMITAKDPQETIREN